TATDNDAVSNSSIAFSTDGGATFSNEIARVNSSATQVVWNIPDNLQTAAARIRVTTRDRSGNITIATSNTFTVQLSPSAAPLLQTDVTFDPPPQGVVAPPR